MPTPSLAERARRVLALALVVRADVLRRLAQRVDERRHRRGRTPPRSRRAGPRSDAYVGARERLRVARDSAASPSRRTSSRMRRTCCSTGRSAPKMLGVLLADRRRQLRLAERLALQQRPAALVGAADDPHDRYSFIARSARGLRAVQVLADALLADVLPRAVAAAPALPRRTAPCAASSSMPAAADAARR